MFTWIVENTVFLSALLAIAAAALAYMWWRTRLGKYAVGVAAIVALIVVVVVLGFGIDTDSKRIERKVHEMAAAVGANNMDLLMKNVSDSFNHHGRTKADLRQRAASAIKSGQVTEIRVWGVQTEELSRQNRSAKITFNAKPKGQYASEVPYLIRATLVLDPDDEWRLKDFDVFNPFAETHQPLPIPNFD
jgi:hypothetical protein